MLDFEKYENYSMEQLEKENVSILLLSEKKRKEFLGYQFNKDFLAWLDKRESDRLKV